MRGSRKTSSNIIPSGPYNSICICICIRVVRRVLGVDLSRFLSSITDAKQFNYVQNSPKKNRQTSDPTMCARVYRCEWLKCHTRSIGNYTVYERRGTKPKITIYCNIVIIIITTIKLIYVFDRVYIIIIIIIIENILLDG